MKRSPIRRRTPLKPMSDKRKLLNGQYEAAKRTWRKGHDGRCEFLSTHRVMGEERMVPVPDVRMNSGHLIQYGPPFGVVRCKARADRNPHHLRLRGKYLSDPEWFCGLCKPHHDWCHANPNEARRLGYLVRP